MNSGVEWVRGGGWGTSSGLSFSKLIPGSCRRLKIPEHHVFNMKIQFNLRGWGAWCFGKVCALSLKERKESGGKEGRLKNSSSGRAGEEVGGGWNYKCMEVGGVVPLRWGESKSTSMDSHFLLCQGPIFSHSLVFIYRAPFLSFSEFLLGAPPSRQLYGSLCSSMAPRGEGLCRTFPVVQEVSI